MKKNLKKLTEVSTEAFRPFSLGFSRFLGLGRPENALKCAASRARWCATSAPLVTANDSAMLLQRTTLHDVRPPLSTHFVLVLLAEFQPMLTNTIKRSSITFCDAALFEMDSLFHSVGRPARRDTLTLPVLVYVCVYWFVIKMASTKASAKRQNGNRTRERSVPKQSTRQRQSTN